MLCEVSELGARFVAQCCQQFFGCQQVLFLLGRHAAFLLRCSRLVSKTVCVVILCVGGFLLPSLIALLGFRNRSDKLSHDELSSLKGAAAGYIHGPLYRTRQRVRNGICDATGFF